MRVDISIEDGHVLISNTETGERIPGLVRVDIEPVTTEQPTPRVFLTVERSFLALRDMPVCEECLPREAAEMDRRREELEREAARWRTRPNETLARAAVDLDAPRAARKDGV